MGNRQLLRKISRNQILNLVRETEEISHRDMVVSTGLSKAAVTSIIKEIVDDGFLLPAGKGESKLGRKPTLMRFDYNARHVVSVEFFADNIQIAILNLDGQIKDRLEFETQKGESPETVIKRFASNAKKLLSKNNLSMSEILGVGASFEGIVDSDNGVLMLSTRSGWRNVPVKQLIKDELDLEAIVVSDGVAMALGEYKYGAGWNSSHIVCFDVDFGIGAIELQNGRVCCGSHNMAGEVGHTTMLLNDCKCKCGKTGCLEAVASGWAILEIIRQRLRDGAESIISEQIHASMASVALRAVFDAFRKGDKLALEVVNEAGLYLGVALAGIVNYADPELVVMTGCVTHESGGVLLDIVQKISQKYILDSGFRAIEIREGTLLGDAALIGNATLIYNEVFKSPVADN